MSEGANREPDPTRHQSLRIAVGGLGGSIIDLAIVMKFHDPDPRNEGDADGLAGQYTVTFVLQRPTNTPVDEYRSASAEAVNGDSHIVVANPAAAALSVPNRTELAIRADGFVFRAVPNPRGRLNRLKSEPFQAMNFEDAEWRARAAFASLLSGWSARLDVPLQIFQTESVELRTGTIRRNFLQPFADVPFVEPIASGSDETFRTYAAMYREALNSNSALYQYLCLYKILEGIRVLRGRLKRRDDRPEERIPKDPASFVPWLNTIFPGWTRWDDSTLSSIFRAEVLGKKAGAVLADYLRPVRHEVAHFFTESGDSALLYPNVLEGKVARWLPLTRCLARLLMKNQFPHAMVIPGDLRSIT